MKHPFTDFELTAIFEAAAFAFGNENTFALCCEAMDLSDDAMTEIKDKLETFMAEEL